MSEEKMKHEAEVETEAEAKVETEAETKAKPKAKGKEKTDGDERKPKTKKDESKAEDSSDAVAEEKERYMRLMAEFQNYKKRVANEKSDIHAFANEKMIVELIEVLDNFERALDNESHDDTESYAKGMKMIFEQFKGVLVKAGLEEMDSLGKDFDPKSHNAVMTEESDEYDSGKITKVLQKGYILNNKVIRPAMVAVAK